MNHHEDFQFTIEAGKAEKHYWLDLFRYRELFYILAWRDIAVRYKQTVIGILWALLQPLLTMIIFVIVFGKIANLPSENIPYPVYVFAAMLPWTFFATAFANAGNSLIGNANLISKVYFPRLIIPAATIIVGIIDFLISFVILIIIMLWYGYYPTWHMLTLPLFLLMAFFAAFGLGVFVASLNVKYRDFKFVIPFIVQFGLFASPVAYGAALIPEAYRILYYLNPMVAVIDGFRWSVSDGATALNTTEIMIAFIVIGVINLWGIVQFRKTEKTFADVI